MNPDFPHPDPADPEARITAYLLGELPPDARAEVERDLARDPELARLRTRLATTIEFVREAAKQPGAEPAPSVVGPRLSRERRAALFAAFKTIRPFPAGSSWRRYWQERRRVVLALAASVTVVLSVGLLLARKTWEQAEVAQMSALAEAQEARVRLETVPHVAGFEGQTPTFAPDGQRLFVRARTEPEEALRQANSDSVKLWSLQPAGGATPAAGPARGVASPQPPAAIARPEADVRLRQRYGLAAQDHAPKGTTATWTELDGDGQLNQLATAGRGTFVANQPAAVPTDGRFLKEKAQDKAAPANVLGDWFALVTNRAAEPEAAHGTLGYAWNRQAERARGGMGAVAGSPGANWNWGTFGGGGFGGGGLASAGSGGGGAGGFGGRPLAEGEARASTLAALAGQPPGPAPIRLGQAPEAAGKPVEAGVAFRMALDAKPDAAAASREAAPAPAAPAAGEPIAALADAEVESAGRDVAVLGDRPLLGRAFRTQSPEAPSPSSAESAPEGARFGRLGLQRGSETAGAEARPLARTAAEGAQGVEPAQPMAPGARAYFDTDGTRRGDDSSRARGRSLALGIEAAKEVEDLEALPLQLPVPAFMGTPADIPLAAGASVTEARDQNALDGIAATGLARLEPQLNTATATPPAAQPPAPSQRPARPATVPAAPSQPSGPASDDLYFADALGTAEARQRSLTDHLSLERYDESLLNKGLPALRTETQWGEAEALARNGASSRLGELPQQVDELRRGGVALADTKAEAEVTESARKERVVEQLVEVAKPPTPSEPDFAAGLVASEAKRVSPRPASPPPVPQPEIATLENNFSTFSLNVADVSFKLAGASLDAGNLPDPASIRVEEFVNAFDYRDPGPVAGVPISFDWERAQYPFAHNREVLRFSIQTAAQGREQGRPLNLVLLLDNSGSMERADRVSIIREALNVLGGQLQPQDKISVVAFARNPRLWVDALTGDRGNELPARVGNLAPEGGTNLEEALKQGYETARRHFLADGVNRVILLTDGAANLGEVMPDSLKPMVEEQRRRGIALDCFGIGWDGYNDELLEVLSRNGDGRYGFVNSVGEVATGFANQLAGALQVAAADVKAQIEFNPARVSNWRQVGYAKHQLTQEQFRDNTVDAAELGAAEAGNALYVVEVNPQGQGPLGVMRVRYRVPNTGQYREHEWALEYNGPAVTQAKASASMRLATTAAAFGEMLSNNPYAAEVNSPALLALLDGVPHVFDPDPRPTQLANMIRQTQAIGGR